MILYYLPLLFKEMPKISHFFFLFKQVVGLRIIVKRIFGAQKIKNLGIFF